MRIKKSEFPQKATKYDPPYSKEEVMEKYGEYLYKKLVSDPIHKWRMNTGIELIHKEPSKKELLRICSNWQAMSEEQKRISDEFSYATFGMSNIEHFLYLIDNEYKDEYPMTAEEVLETVGSIYGFKTEL